MPVGETYLAGRTVNRPSPAPPTARPSFFQQAASVMRPPARPTPPPPSRGFSGAIGRIAQTVSPRGVAQTRARQVAAVAQQSRLRAASARPQGGGGDIRNPRFIGFGGTQNTPAPPRFAGPGGANWNRNNPYQSPVPTPQTMQRYRIAARSWGLSPDDPNLVPKVDRLMARQMRAINAVLPRPAATAQSRAANTRNQLYALSDTLAQGAFGTPSDSTYARVTP